MAARTAAAKAKAVAAVVMARVMVTAKVAAAAVMARVMVTVTAKAAARTRTKHTRGYVLF